MLRSGMSLLFLTVVVMVTISSPVVGQDKAKWAATDFDQVDADFAFQGEYYGTIVSGYPVREQETIGLQVIALGHGRFDAVIYSGGLPGNGWYGGDTVKLEGVRHDETLIVEGSPYRLIVESGTALVFLENGRPLGQITRIHRESPSIRRPVPMDGQVLFNGASTKQFANGRMTRDGLLKVGTQMNQSHRDYTLHLEFRLPYMPYARGQGRSNSGVYLQSRYEVQILDSFGLAGHDNECGGLYKLRRPDVNMCLPPLAWQTYDIQFTAPRFDKEGKKIHDARLTVWHNGTAIHNHVAVARKTGGGSAEGPNLLPIKLQDHGNPVRFRNIWIADRHESAAIDSHRPQSWFGEYTASDGTWERVEMIGPPAKRGYWLW